MIDLDRLDEGLASAMTDEVRALRGITPTWATPAQEAWGDDPEAERGTGSDPHDAVPWDDDELWAEAGFAWPEPKDPYARLQPVPNGPPRAKAAPRAKAPDKVQTPPSLKRVDVTFETPLTQPPVTEPPVLKPPGPEAPPRRPVAARAAAPPPTPAPATTGPAGPPPSVATENRVAVLMAQGRIAEADAEIARVGTPMQWRIMRALFDGRRNEAAASLRLVTKLGRGDQFWVQRYWVAMEWGEDAEQYQVLDHCREQAYRHGETQWWGALTLLLARLGRQEEAGRELSATMGGLASWPDDRNRLDIVTNLIEAAYLMGDAKAAEALGARLRTSAARTPLVVVGPGWVCRGAIARYEALAAAASGQWKVADERFSAAADAHADLGAQPLLARTLVEWGHTVLPHDHSRGSRYVEHGIGIADRLHLIGMGHLTRSPALAS